MKPKVFSSSENQSRYKIHPGLLLSLVFLVSCGQSQQKETEVVLTPETPVKASLCDTLKIHFSESLNPLVAPMRTEHIERQFQRVLRHDCAGNLESDKIETIQSPHLDLNLENLSQKSFKSVFVFNENTCANTLTKMPVDNWPLIGLLSAITGDGDKKISIKGDLASASLTFRLAEGTNHIFVRYFHDCRPTNIEGNDVLTIGASNCENSKEFTTVKYPIHITYTEKTLSGSITIDPTPESCAEKKKTKL